jgi:hypothetical protein
LDRTTNRFGGRYDLTGEPSLHEVTGEMPSGGPPAWTESRFWTGTHRGASAPTCGLGSNGASASREKRWFRIKRGFGLRRDGATGPRWETAETRTGAALSLRSKPREGETTVKLPRGFARRRSRHPANSLRHDLAMLLGPPFREDGRTGTLRVPYEPGGYVSLRAPSVDPCVRSSTPCATILSCS